MSRASEILEKLNDVTFTKYTDENKWKTDVKKLGAKIVSDNVYDSDVYIASVSAGVIGVFGDGFGSISSEAIKSPEQYLDTDTTSN